MGSGDKHGGVGVEGPKRGPRSRAPLFARLFDFEPRRTEEAQPHRVLTRDRVIESIHIELARLLNTRCSETIERLGGQERTVMNYGLPDFFTLSPASDGDRQRLAKLILDAIRAFEPRLANPIVGVTVDPRDARVLRFTVEGMLTLGNLTEPVLFPLVIEERGGAIRLAMPINT